MAEPDDPAYTPISRKMRSTPTGLKEEPLNIIILGASFAGLSCAHHFLDDTLARLRTTSKAPNYRLILISPSTHIYWNIGAPRALVKPGLIKEEDLFIPIESGFHRHRGMPFLFVQAEAQNLDPVAKTINIECVTNAERKRISSVLKSSPDTYSVDPHAQQPQLDDKGNYPNPKLHQLTYHALICATGSSAHSDLLSLHGPHLTTIGALQAFHARVAAARTIIVCGGGTSGVETAGQLSTYWNSTASTLPGLRRRVKGEARKTLILITGSERLLPALKPSVGAKAKRMLEALGVHVRLGVRVEKVEEEFDLTGQTRVGLSDETTMIVDAYVACTGVSPNSSYLPKNLVDDKGYVNCNTETLRVEDATLPSVSTDAAAAAVANNNTNDASATSTNDARTSTLLDELIPAPQARSSPHASAASPAHPTRLYAIGDCASYSQNYVLDVYAAVPITMSNLLTDLLLHELRTSTPTNEGQRNAKNEALARLLAQNAVYHKRVVDSQLCPISRFGGVGVLMNLSLPRFLVWGLKGRDYMVGKGRRVVFDGGNPYAVTGKYKEF